jgi:hypothetical protein
MEITDEKSENKRSLTVSLFKSKFVGEQIVGIGLVSITQRFFSALRFLRKRTRKNE